MPELVEASRGEASRTVAKSVCGVLMIWAGAALLLQWSWSVGLTGAGVILLGAQGVRRYLGIELDGFGVVAGALLVIFGVWSMFDVSIDLVPMLLIVAGIALLVTTWTRTKGRSPGEPTGMHASPPPRA